MIDRQTEALHIAALNDDTATVKELVLAGADIYSRDDLRLMNAFEHAVLRGNYEAAKAMLSAIFEKTRECPDPFHRLIDAEDLTLDAMRVVGKMKSEITLQTNSS